MSDSGEVFSYEYDSKELQANYSNHISDVKTMVIDDLNQWIAGITTNG